MGRLNKKKFLIAAAQWRRQIVGLSCRSWKLAILSLFGKTRSLTVKGLRRRNSPQAGEMIGMMSAVLISPASLFVTAKLVSNAIHWCSKTASPGRIRC